MFTRNWADIEDDGPISSVSGSALLDPTRPPHQPADAASGGHPGPSDRVEVEYQERNGQAVKITKTFKQKRVSKWTNPFVQERARWFPSPACFGKCKDPKFEETFGKNTPVVNNGETEVKLEIDESRARRQIGSEEKFFDKVFRLLNKCYKKVKNGSMMLTNYVEGEWTRKGLLVVIWLMVVVVIIH